MPTDVPDRQPKHGLPVAPPTLEAIVVHLIDSIVHSPEGEKLHCLPPKQKQHYRQFEQHPERLTVSGYEDITGRLADYLAQSNRVLDGRHRQLMMEEIRIFLARYENLLLQLTTSRATARQIRWSLCARFFIPWAALRIAFHLRKQSPKDLDAWFIPSVGQGVLGFTFMQVVNREVRRPRETQDAMARRLCESLPAGDKAALARNLGEDFSRYRLGKMLASDARINLVVTRSCGAPDLRMKLILARAIDRSLEGAIKTFGLRATVALMECFRLLFRRSHELLFGLKAELQEDDAGAWQGLQSPTFMGNTPFDAERIYPLTDEFMGLLAPLLSSELERIAKGKRLSRVPTKLSDFDKAAYPELEPYGGFLPDEIHEAVRRSDFVGAVAASRRLFPNSKSVVSEAARVGKFFARLANEAYERPGTQHPLRPTEDDLPKVMAEGLRLLKLAHDKARGSIRAQHGICLFRMLTKPPRPKTKSEHTLARKLSTTVVKFYRQAGRNGTAEFLLGCLLWLEGSNEAAIRKFEAAVRFGRASCGEDWITLLRMAPILARSTSRRQRRRKYFLKLSKLEGVLYREAAPKTNLLVKELRQQSGASEFQLIFQPFPK